MAGNTRDAHVALSKFLSFVLRHEPGSIGITLDAQGWVAVDELLARAKEHGQAFTREVLLDIVATSPKQRFALSPDGLRIRANQGHSVEVDLAYEQTTPPEVLYHGTIAEFLASIKADGLKKMARHHVHLSATEDTATTVAIRRGKPVLLRVASGQMHRDGHAFYRSANGVWLTEHVPPQYLAASTRHPSSQG